ncbi:hypothetical protein BGZ72_002393, partial [Mortierella alpina]
FLHRAPGPAPARHLHPRPKAKAGGEQMMVTEMVMEGMEGMEEGFLPAMCRTVATLPRFMSCSPKSWDLWHSSQRVSRSIPEQESRCRRM